VESLTLYAMRQSKEFGVESGELRLFGSFPLFGLRGLGGWPGRGVFFREFALCFRVGGVAGDAGGAAAAVSVWVCWHGWFTWRVFE